MLSSIAINAKYSYFCTNISVACENQPEIFTILARDSLYMKKHGKLLKIKSVKIVFIQDKTFWITKIKAKVFLFFI